MTPAQATSTYGEFAAKIRAVGLVRDPWLDGQPRFATEPTYLSATDYRAVCHAAEAMTEVHQEVVTLVREDPELLRSYFSLGPVGRVLWEASDGLWHGMARADIFLTQSGPVFCELNADTPSGHAEAITLSQVFRQHTGEDPNRNLEHRTRAWFEFVASRLGLTLDQLSVGILYPTELTEDLGLIQLYRAWLTAWGARVTLGSPFNLASSGDGGVNLFGVPCDVMLRHYKTDWWTEREPAWKTARYTDDAPLASQLALLLSAEAAGRVTVLNPWGALIAQNKRCLALMWEQKQRFSVRAQAYIEQFLPESQRMESFDIATLKRERASWVLKSDYGCEGEETLVGEFTSDTEWSTAIDDIVPRRWVVQRAFTPRQDQHGRICNLGVYLVAGAASGMYGRLSVGPTNVTALSTAIRIMDSNE